MTEAANPTFATMLRCVSPTHSPHGWVLPERPSGSVRLAIRTHACSGRSFPAVSGAHAIDTAAVSESCLWPHADDLALPGATAQYLFVCVVVAGADLCIITLRIL